MLKKYANENEYKFVEITPFVSGDPSGDSVADASMVLYDYALNSTGSDGNFNVSQNLAGDVNNDGSVDASDASKILSFYAYTATGGKNPIGKFIACPE